MAGDDIQTAAADVSFLGVPPTWTIRLRRGQVIEPRCSHPCVEDIVTMCNGEKVHTIFFIFFSMMMFFYL